MATITQMKANTRILLADPKPQKPSDRHLLLAVLRQAQGLHNRLAMTGAAWDIDEMPLTVSANRSDYQINVDSSFGKPMQLVRTDTNSRDYVETPVDFFEIQNLNYDWNYPQSYAGQTRVGWYRKGSDLFIRFQGKPQENAKYRITYAVGNWMDTAALDDSPIQSEFHPLIETLAARSLLPGSEWSDDKKENAEKRRELGAIFSLDIERMDDDFTRYSLSLTQPRMTTRVSSFDEWA